MKGQENINRIFKEIILEKTKLIFGVINQSFGIKDAKLYC